MIPLTAQLTNRITTHPVTSDGFDRVRVGIRGWTDFGHWVVFTHLLALPEVKSVLVCGVYHGLDLALLEEAARRANRSVKLTGVDLFEDAPCADWDDAHRERKTWEAAGYKAPPSMDIAQKNAPSARLVKSDAGEFMEATEETFDVVYLDTSHDEATLRREIPAALRIVNAGGILCGDDYSDCCNGASGWGVDRAVQALLPHHFVLFNRIWASLASNPKPL